MGYVTTSLIVDGALEEERMFVLDPDRQFERYAEHLTDSYVRDDAKGRWELYRVDHPHRPLRRDDDGCSCVGDLQDHRPALTLGQADNESEDT